MLPHICCLNQYKCRAEANFTRWIGVRTLAGGNAVFGRTRLREGRWKGDLRVFGPHMLVIPSFRNSPLQAHQRDLKKKNKKTKIIPATSMSFSASNSTSNQLLVKQGVAIAAGALVLYGALRLLRARVYDALIVNLTTGWYEHVLKRMSPNSKLLDVGIGTGLALANNRSLLVSKNITVDGVDYDLDYVKRCHVLMKDHRLDSVVNAHHASIYDYKGGPYDAVYFSSSLMIMPDPVAALKHTMSMLKPNGKVYVTQTIQTKRSKLVELGKPLLKFLTTIDFGNVTYEEDLLANFKKAGLTLIENVAISGSTMASTRSFRIFVLEA